MLILAERFTTLKIVLLNHCLPQYETKLSYLFPEHASSTNPFKGFGTTPGNYTNLIQRELLTYGPVLACFTLYEDFQHYSSGEGFQNN